MRAFALEPQPGACLLMRRHLEGDAPCRTALLIAGCSVISSARARSSGALANGQPQHYRDRRGRQRSKTLGRARPDPPLSVRALRPKCSAWPRSLPANAWCVATTAVRSAALSYLRLAMPSRAAVWIRFRVLLEPQGTTGPSERRSARRSRLWMPHGDRSFLAHASACVSREVYRVLCNLLPLHRESATGLPTKAAGEHPARVPCTSRR
jgi:hypothetical protein